MFVAHCIPSVVLQIARFESPKGNNHNTNDDKWWHIVKALRKLEAKAMLLIFEIEAKIIIDLGEIQNATSKNQSKLYG